jgi:hypothetical protein
MAGVHAAFAEENYGWICRLRTPDSWKVRETKLPLTLPSPRGEGEPPPALGLILVSPIPPLDSFVRRIRSSEASA